MLAMPNVYKVFGLCAIGCVILYAYIALKDFSDNKMSSYKSDNINIYKSARSASDETSNSSSEIKYILQWTRPDTEPFVFMGTGQKGFIDRKCAFTNCFVTSNRSLLSDLTKYEVVLFHGPELVYVPIKNSEFPKNRSSRQKYVFVSMESADYYPICSDRLNGFFNWTWTYKLNSDSMLGYLLVKDSNNKVIGPKTVMHWMKLEDMEPMGEEFKEKLKSKSKAAAWFVSNCDGRSGRTQYANDLKKELATYNLVLDIFGKCGTMKCERDRGEDCNKMVSDSYYFYLAFENSFSEDYVTEKLLTALQNDAVPVVFGGANYTRFLPDGIYLNAKKLGPKILAATMNKLIHNPDQYADFFRWKNHYSYHSRDESPENNDYCEFCAMINDENRMRKQTTIQNFKNWWDGPGRC